MRPRTVSWFKPTSSSVAIIPGIDLAAPDLAETNSGHLLSPKRLLVTLSRKAMPSESMFSRALDL